jgi:hypothetical protein
VQQVFVVIAQHWVDNPLRLVRRDLDCAVDQSLPDQNVPDVDVDQVHHLQHRELLEMVLVEPIKVLLGNVVTVVDCNGKDFGNSLVVN